MRFTTATSGGHRGRPTEDWVGVSGTAAVLVDGAGIPGADHLCRHGVPWFAASLGGAVLERVADPSGADLRHAFAAALADVADRHRDTCDLTDPSSPQGSIAVVRVGDEVIEHLVLGDAYVVVVGGAGATSVVTDGREVEAQQACVARFAHLPEGSPERASARAEAVAHLRARRNTPGGYWVAKDDPAAAAEAVTGSAARREVRAVALLSNGAARAVLPYGLTTWSGLMSLLDDEGPGSLVRRVREAERSGDEGRYPGCGEPDDASVVHVSVDRGHAGAVPELRRVPAGGVALAVRTWEPEAASGAVPAVLLPGTGETGATWGLVAPHLAVGRTVLAVDLRGHGDSDRPGRYSIAAMADDVAALLAEVADGPVDLVGHSLGGLVALRVAARHPGRVRRLVLEDVGMPHPRVQNPPARPPGGLPFDWAVVEQVRLEIDAPAADWPDVARAVTAPTLVVAGGPRSLVAADHVRELVDALSDGRGTTLDTGHEVHAEKPAEFTDAVRAFLEG